MYSISRRKRIIRLLKARPSLTPTQIANQLEASDIQLSPDEVITELEHIRKSLQNEDHHLAARPPECAKCGFTDFNKLLNNPSQCPDCRCPTIREVQLTIQPDE